MKVTTVFFTAVLLVACSQSPGNDTTPVEMAGVDTPASALGTVDSVDAKAGKITISHGPVESLQWPAMTMAFKATPTQLASVQPGQKVEFDFIAQGMSATLTSITPARKDQAEAPMP